MERSAGLEKAADPALLRRRERALARVIATWDRLSEGAERGAIRIPQGENLGGPATRSFLESGAQELLWVAQQLQSNGLRLGGERALDFGCGPGRVTGALSSRYREVLALDVSPRMVELARVLHADRPHVEFRTNRQPILAGIEDASFDLVYSNHVLQHLPWVLIDGYVAEFGRVLRPGGLLVLQLHGGVDVPILNSLPEEWVAWLFARRPRPRRSEFPRWEVHWVRPGHLVRRLDSVGLSVRGTLRDPRNDGRMIPYWYFAVRR